MGRTMRRMTRGRGGILLFVAFGFFALAALFAGIPDLDRNWPWLVPGGLAAWVLSQIA